MKSLQSISPEQGAALWNEFAGGQATAPPVSFNPSLPGFYTAYFGWKPYYFLLQDSGRTAGIFPLVNTGRAFVSLPHFSYGGLLTDRDSRFDTRALIAKLTGLVASEKPPPGFLLFDLKGWEIEEKPRPQFTENCFVRSLWHFEGAGKSEKLSSFVRLPDSTEKMMSLLSPNLRRKVRKSMGNGLQTRQGGKELLAEFYTLYARNMHKLGSPVYARDFFRSLLENICHGGARLFVTSFNGKAVGAGFLMSYFGFFENTWFATDASFHKYHVSDQLHWQMISHAIGNKGEIYSLGRSTAGGNVHRYKSHWPVDDRPLFYFPAEKKHRLKNQQWLSSAWKLLPFGLTTLLGPRLVRHIY